MTDPFYPIPHINAYLDEFLASRNLPASLRHATAYSLLAPGKRLRPVLCWHACEAFGIPGEQALASAAALELVHCFSLVHDDLPALDNDDLRRGRPTLHKHAGEAMAILAGDLMLTLAFALLGKNAPESHGQHLIRELSSATEHMIGGQVFDTLGGLEHFQPRDQVEAIHSSKTGALIRAACRMGVLSAYASRHIRENGLTAVMPERDAIEHISSYADALGLIFQITDDLLDVTQSAEHVGKRTGKDAAAGKVTYPGILGIEGSQAEVERQLRLALKALEPLGEAGQMLNDVCVQMAKRTK